MNQIGNTLKFTAILALAVLAGCGKGSEDKKFDAGPAKPVAAQPASQIAPPPVPPIEEPKELSIDEMDFDQLNAAAVEAEKAGKVLKAETYRIAAVEKAQTIQPLDFHYPDSLRTLGFFYHFQGNTDKAEEAFLKLLKAQEEMYGQDDSGVADTLIHLTSIYNAVGKFENSLPLYERAVKIREKVFGENDPSVAQILEYHAGTLKNMTREADAKKLEDRAAKIRANETKEKK